MKFDAEKFYFCVIGSGKFIIKLGAKVTGDWLFRNNVVIKMYYRDSTGIKRKLLTSRFICIYFVSL